MRTLLHSIFESIVFATSALRSNALRSTLTLSGVTIGIFSIISVFTAIDYLRDQISESIQSMGSDLVYIQKWPWTPEEGQSEYPWWKYMNRPNTNMEEAEFLMRRSQLVQDLTFFIKLSQNISYYDNHVGNTSVMGVTHDFERVWNFNIANGRYFSTSESDNGSRVAIIGTKLSKDLMSSENPIGKKIKMMGVHYEIIGVFELKGSDISGNSLDDVVVIPFNQAKSMFNVRADNVNPTIIAKATAGTTAEELSDELAGLLREKRRIKPSDENTFALNRISMIQKVFDGIFVIINFAGWFIGGFSILVGGFGIANIMFVSVRERTRIIGIQKALGAKRFFILSQFLFEGIFLALLGGVAGLILIFLMVSLLKLAFDTPFSLSLANILLGVTISVTIGLVSGFVPAWTASRMNPVNAINQV